LSSNHGFKRLALAASETPQAAETASELRDMHDWVPMEEADALVVLGGDGFMLHTLHRMLDSGRLIPTYGINRGPVGFLMNR
jgi:NAD+ kinase